MSEKKYTSIHLGNFGKKADAELLKEAILRDETYMLFDVTVAPYQGNFVVHVSTTCDETEDEIKGFLFYVMSCELIRLKREAAPVKLSKAQKRALYTAAARDFAGVGLATGKVLQRNGLAYMRHEVEDDGYEGWYIELTRKGKDWVAANPEKE